MRVNDTTPRETLLVHKINKIFKQNLETKLFCKFLLEKISNKCIISQLHVIYDLMTKPKVPSDVIQNGKGK